MVQDLCWLVPLLMILMDLVPELGGFFVVVVSPYIFIYNAFWLAPVVTRRAVSIRASEI